jgi:hypothetical protein
MSYAGVYEAGPHDCYPPNCAKCIVARQGQDGVVVDGVLHSDNGAGWCVGHIEETPERTRCTVLVRHCPVLNTPEQLAANLLEDWEAKVTAAERDVIAARQTLRRAERNLRQVLRERKG